MPSLAEVIDPVVHGCGALQDGRPVTLREAAFAMGWPSIDGCGDCFKPEIGCEFWKLPRRQAMSLLGNSMHLTVMSAWFLCVHSHIIRKDLIKEWLPDLRCLTSESS